MNSKKTSKFDHFPHCLTIRVLKRVPPFTHARSGVRLAPPDELVVWKRSSIWAELCPISGVAGWFCLWVRATELKLGGESTPVLLKALQTSSP